MKDGEIDLLPPEDDFSLGDLVMEANKCHDCEQLQTKLDIAVKALEKIEMDFPTRYEVNANRLYKDKITLGQLNDVYFSMKSLIENRITKALQKIKGEINE